MKLKDFKLGATGRFPYGKADDNDEGELRMAITADAANGLVRLQFGKPVGWLGLPSSHARRLAALLIEKADQIDKRKG